MNLKITFDSNLRAQLEGFCFALFSSFLFIYFIISFEKIIEDFSNTLSFIAGILVTAFVGWLQLKVDVITFNKNYFLIGGSTLFQQKYLWKNVQEIKVMNDISRRKGWKPSDLYINLKIVNKNIEKTINENKYKNVKIKIDNPPIQGETQKEKALQKRNTLIEMLNFCIENYAYVDIHSIEIDRPEIMRYVDELRKNGVHCEFYS